MKKTLLVLVLPILSWFAVDYIDVRQAVAQQREAQAAQQQQATERYEDLKSQQAEWRREYQDDKQVQIQTTSEILRALGRIEGRLSAEDSE